MEYFPSADVTDPTQAIGFDVDGARAVAAALGLTLEIKNTAFDALIPDLQAGRCDIVWSGLYINADRLAVADAVPYMATGHVVMVPKGNPPAHHRAHRPVRQDRRPSRAAASWRSASTRSTRSAPRRQPAINIQGYPKVADELQQIVLGRVDAVWETDSAVSDWMLRNPDQYEVAYALPQDDTYGIYYTKGSDRAGRRPRRGGPRAQGRRHAGRDRGDVPDRPGHPGRHPVGRPHPARRRPAAGAGAVPPRSW